MVEFESCKFLVIKTEYINSMSGKNRQRFLWVLRDIQKQRKRLGKKPNPFYYVCNQDEPYAKQVIEIILGGEKAKEQSR